MTAFTLDRQTEMSRSFSSGDATYAYRTHDLEHLGLDEMQPDERAAFVVGFFASLTLDEIGSDREAFDEAFFSPAGRWVVEVAKFTGNRADEYAAEGK